MTDQHQLGDAPVRRAEPDKDDEDDGYGFEALAFDDVRGWHYSLEGVDAAIRALRAAQSDGLLAAAKGQLVEAFAHARDFETAAMHVMSRYGYAAGVTVPGVGLVRIRYVDATLRMLEIVTGQSGSAIDGLSGPGGSFVLP